MNGPESLHEPLRSYSRQIRVGLVGVVEQVELFPAGVDSDGEVPPCIRVQHTVYGERTDNLVLITGNEFTALYGAISLAESKFPTDRLIGKLCIRHSLNNNSILTDIRRSLSRVNARG